MADYINTPLSHHAWDPSKGDYYSASIVADDELARLQLRLNKKRDYIAILDKGTIIKSAKTLDLRETVKRFILTDTNDLDPKQLPGILDATSNAGKLAITIEDCDEQKRSAINNAPANLISEVALNLDEIFEAYVIGNRGERITA